MESNPPGRIKKWIVSGRPWALPASTMPVVFGTSLAVVIHGAPFNFFRFFLALAAMIILHTAANMLSDVFDFQRGLDRDITPVSGAIVRGWLSAEQVRTGSAVLFVLGCVIGLYLVYLSGTILLIVGAVGVAIGLCYTGLKYHALGDFAVFLNFGILGSLGAWVVQTKSFSWIPIIWTIPMAMLVSAILHANNWRDSLSDQEKRVTTIASLFGDTGSLWYYGFLIFGSTLMIFLLILGPRLLSGRMMAMPLTFLLVVLGLPRALVFWGRARRRRNPRQPMDFIVLDGATAQYNLTFGLICTTALWLSFILDRL